MSAIRVCVGPRRGVPRRPLCVCVTPNVVRVPPPRATPLVPPPRPSWPARPRPLAPSYFAAAWVVCGGLIWPTVHRIECRLLRSRPTYAGGMVLMVTPASFGSAAFAHGEGQPYLAKTPLSHRMSISTGTKQPPIMPPTQPPSQPLSIEKEMGGIGEGGGMGDTLGGMEGGMEGGGDDGNWATDGAVVMESTATAVSAVLRNAEARGSVAVCVASVVWPACASA